MVSAGLQRCRYIRGGVRMTNSRWCPHDCCACMQVFSRWCPHVSHTRLHDLYIRGGVRMNMLPRDAVRRSLFVGSELCVVFRVRRSIRTFVIIPVSHSVLFLTLWQLRRLQSRSSLASGVISAHKTPLIATLSCLPAFVLQAGGLVQEGQVKGGCSCHLLAAERA